MPVRRLLVLLVLLVFLLGAIGAAQRDALRRPDTTTAAEPAPSGAPPPVEGALPRDEVVRAEIGDRVVVRVASDSPDVAKVLDLGLQTAVGPQLPGELAFAADRAGRFPVTLELGERRAGWIEIREAGAR